MNGYRLDPSYHEFEEGHAQGRHEADLLLTQYALGISSPIGMQLHIESQKGDGQFMAGKREGLWECLYDYINPRG